MAAIACFLALVLASSALVKARAPDRLAEAAARLAGVNGAHGFMLMVLAGTAEALAALGLAVSLIRSVAALPGAALAVLIWGAYAVALWRRRGQVLDCGCDLAARPRPVSTAQILRAGLLAMLACLAGAVNFSTLSMAAAPPAPDSGTWMAPLAAIGFFALYLGWSEIIAIPAPAWRKS